MSPSRHRRPQFSVGSVLGSAFSIWTRNIVPFTALIVLVHLPNLVYAYVTLSSDLSETAVARFDLISPIATQLLNLVVTGALVYGVVRQLSNDPVGMGECITVGLSRLLPVLGTGILAGLIVVLGFVPAILLALMGAPELILFLAAFIPVIILMCMLWVAVPAAVIEKPGVLGAIKRSAKLTKGSKGSIFLILLLLGIINEITEWILDGAIDDPMTAVWAGIGLVLFLSGLTATASAVAYYQLRQTKEGVGIEELKQVFA